jgi:hypothetical protein
MPEDSKSMSHEKRLGWAALVMGAVGVGVVYLWPDARWIGWGFFGLGILAGLMWLYLELKAFSKHRRRIAACTFVGLVALIALLAGLPLKRVERHEQEPQNSNLSEIKSDLEEIKKKLKSANSVNITEDISGRKGDRVVRAQREGTDRTTKQEVLTSRAEAASTPTVLERPCTIDNAFADCGAAQMQMNARGLLNEYVQRYWHYKSQEHWWASVGGGNHPDVQMIAREWNDFEKDYSTKFKGKLLTLRRTLGMRLNVVPTTGIDVEEIYPDPPFLMETFVESQIKDLYILLNEFERENGLSLTVWKAGN